MGGLQIVPRQERKIKAFLLHNIPAPYRLPLFQELARRLDLHVFFCRGTTEGRLWKTDLDRYSFKRKILRNFTLGPFVFSFTIIRHLSQIEVDVYLVGENGLETMIPILWVFLASKLFRKPLIVWSGKFDTKWTEQQLRGNRKYAEWILTIYRKFLYQNASAFVAYSKKAKKYLIRKGVPREKVFLGGQFMPEELVKRVCISKQDTKYRDKLIILTLSYLSKRKGIDYLIRAFRELNFDDALLLIAGSGEEEAKLKKLARENPNIHFIGYVDENEKSKWYSIADIFVLPTLFDPWALVINEAMYFGLPIVISDAAGSSEMINGNGFVVPAGDKEALKKTLLRLMEDEELRESMGERSSQVVRTCSLRNGTKPFLEAIKFAVSCEIS